MAENCVVIVESPAKARTIKKFLPKNFVVEASMGHLRDLPQTAADIPAKYKDQPWARVGVDVENDFQPLYVTVKGKSKIISNLRQLVKKADILYLATDEDREGESISWHLIELLKPKIPIKRMVFHEITKKAIQEALENSRDIDERLVRAQEARRILDRLYGFTLSPLIWKKIAYGLSAGRVQSVGVRLLVERERERLAFVKAEYWGLKALLEKDQQEFEARLVHADGKRVAIGKDFAEEDGKPKKPNEVVVLDQKRVQAIETEIAQGKWRVAQVDEKNVTARPSPPFITSTLQQEGNRKLGLSARDTMRIAQRLYESGLITYMRTDSPNLSQQAIGAARDAVQKLYGPKYLSPEPRNFSSKSKSAQEAHEAIRPAGESFVHPDQAGLSGKEKSLYELIWKRTVATQMADAKKLSVNVKIEVGDFTFSSSGMRITFPGFLRAYAEGSDDPQAALDNREVLLPDLSESDVLQRKATDPTQHETKPPARFTEASLVQRLEKEGVGRPSTYASIIGTVIERGYARKIGNALTPTFTAFSVAQILERHFEQLVDYKFTSQMEASLDEIARGDREWVPYLKDFYLGKKGLRSQVETNEKIIKPEESRAVNLLKLKDVEIRVGRFGPYLVRSGGEEEIRASIPEDISPSELTEEKIEEILEMSARGPQPIGKHPDTGEDIFCLLGRYGPYVQLGEVKDDPKAVKRASVPKEIDYRNISVEQATHLLSLPRELGKHPESGEPILANRGRFGPYIVHKDDFRSLKKDDNVFTVGLERALEILAQEKKSRRSAKVLKDLGNHPKTKKKITLMDGKYGPYFKFGSKNVGIPKEVKPEEIDLKKALEIIDGGDAPEAATKAAKKLSKKKKVVKKKKRAKKKAASKS